MWREVDHCGNIDVWVSISVLNQLRSSPLVYVGRPLTLSIEKELSVVAQDEEQKIRQTMGHQSNQANGTEIRKTYNRGTLRFRFQTNQMSC